MTDRAAAGPRPMHLVGSVALSEPAKLFRELGATVGPYLRRVPDGEPGGRNLWISWQYPLLRANPFLQVDAAEPVNPASGFLKLKLADGARAEDIRFGELGYAREARSSYVDFCRARERGELAADTRFQVCLPTPFACLMPFIGKASLASVEPAYERAMVSELAMLFAEIPHADLALQWDVCVEMVLWDGRSKFYTPPWLGALDEEIMARLRRVCAAVPAAVELGVHLCYGDWEAKHFIEPIDMGAMVQFANRLKDEIAHLLAFIHMPVPIARDDDAYFKPLADLRLDPRTQLFLGLLHLDDGLVGARRRIRAAERHLSEFGLATECGLGRCKTPAVVSSIFRLHAQACATGI